MGCCKGAEYGNWCEDVEIAWTDPETGEDYCLFHAPAEHKLMDEEEVHKYILNKLESNDGVVDLRGSNLTTCLDISNITFSDLKLSYATFHQPVFLTRSYFKHQLSIIDAVFFGGLHFTDSILMGSLYIWRSTFKEHLFLGLIKSSEGIVIAESDCTKEVHVSVVEPTAKIYISLRQPKKISISAPYHKLSVKKVSISVKSPSNSNTITVQNMNIQSLELGTELVVPTHITNCEINTFSSLPITFHQELIFNSCSFNRLNINSYHLRFMEFIGCSFPREKNRATTTNDIPWFEKQETTQNNADLPASYCREREDLYRELKTQAQKNEAQILASDWHYAEKFFCEKRLFTEGTFFEWFILWAYRKLSDYGESVGKASTWLLFFILSSFILGAAWPTSIAPATSTINQLANNALPYIPLGVSPPKDIGIVRFLQVFWQVLITFQATLLGFALRNRYRR